MSNIIAERRHHHVKNAARRQRYQPARSELNATAQLEAAVKVIAAEAASKALCLIGPVLLRDGMWLIHAAVAPGLKYEFVLGRLNGGDARLFKEAMGIRAELIATLKSSFDRCWSTPHAEAFETSRWWHWPSAATGNAERTSP